MALCQKCHVSAIGDEIPTFLDEHKSHSDAIEYTEVKDPARRRSKKAHSSTVINSEVTAEGRVFRTENKTIRLLEVEPKRIHPAIDFVDGRAYVGVWLPTEVTIEPKKESDKPRTYLQDDLFLIDSNGGLIYAGEPDELRGQGFILADDSPTRIRRRWSLQDIQKFLEEQDSPPPKAVFEAVRDIIAYYLEFNDPRVYDFAALWIIGSYFYHIFDAYPYVYLNGIKRVGKTKFLTLIALLAHNGLLSADITTASIHRGIQSLRCTLCIDENETLHDLNERTMALRAALLSGFMKLSTALKVEGEEGKRKYLAEFELYSPKALANIFGIEDILEDRAITIVMLRALNPVIRDRKPKITDPVWQEVRDKIYRFFVRYASPVAEVYDATGEGSVGSEGCVGSGEGVGIESREALLWRPVLALAHIMEKDGLIGLVDRTIALARDTAKQRLVEDATESTDLIVLQVLREKITKDDWCSVKIIKEGIFEAYGTEPPKWLTTEWLGRSLRRLGFNEKRRLGTGVQYHLSPESVRIACVRNGLLPPSLDPTQPTQPSLPTPIIVPKPILLEPVEFPCRKCGASMIGTVEVRRHERGWEYRVVSVAQKPLEPKFQIVSEGGELHLRRKGKVPSK